MDKQKKNQGEYTLIPIDEEKEKVKAIVEWIAEVFNYAGPLPPPYGKKSAHRRWPDEPMSEN